jgi:hypothetical protein
LYVDVVFFGRVCGWQGNQISGKGSHERAISQRYAATSPESDEPVEGECPTCGGTMIFSQHWEWESSCAAWGGPEFWALVFIGKCPHCKTDVRTWTINPMLPLQ